MTGHEHHDEPRAALPELERLLLRAAQRRAARRFGGMRRRWLLGLAAGSLVLAGGATAATDVLFHVDSGRTSDGAYTIERRAPSPDAAGAQRAGSICLQLRLNGGGPAYGCGERPTAAKPFGVVIADAEAEDRVIYGLVSDDVARVSVLGSGDDHTDTTTRVKPGLPGRFFSVVVPNRGRIELVGYDAAGRERARIGSRQRPEHKPLSRDEAIAQGDLAGFAPTIPSPSSFRYRGATITPAEAAERDLSCAQNREGVRCYDSLAELDREYSRSSPDGR